MRARDPIVFHTANGSTATNKEAEIDLGTFDMTSQAYVLDDTPSVMSLGKRCMEEGYSFVWPSGKMPFMITKFGSRIDLTMHDNIPYIDLDTVECSPHDCCLTSRIHELLEKDHASEDNFDDLDDVGRTSRRVHLDGASGFEVLNEDQDGSHHIKKLTKKKKSHGTREDEWHHLEKKLHLMKMAMNQEHHSMVLHLVADPEDEGRGAPEDAIEGDEDDIEVDVVEGESRVAKGGTLKREANSLNHKLTHRYKNPYCDHAFVQKWTFQDSSRCI